MRQVAERGARPTLYRMARDPDQGASFVFDLVEDPEDPGEPREALGGAAPATDGHGHGADEPPEDEAAADGGWSWRGLRLLAPVAAVLAVVLGTGLTVDGLRDAERVERVTALPGGVTDVSSPLRELWSVDRTAGGNRVDQDSLEGSVAVLGGDLVLVADTELVALEVATGERAWTRQLGQDADCGPMGVPGRTETATTAVVCLEGAEGERTVTRVGPDGSSSPPRVLPAADTRSYGEPRPGPDGTLLRAQRVGPASSVDLGDAVCDETGGCSGTVEAGRDISLRAEDAVTGEERWSAVVPFQATPADQCSSWISASWVPGQELTSDRQVVAADTFGAQISSDLVWLQGCGITSAVAPDGVVLGSGLPPGSTGFESLRTGGFAAYTFADEVQTVVYAETGESLFEIRGYALEPVVTDGTGSGMLLASDEDALRMRAHDLDGTVRWDAVQEEWGYQFLAQVRGTALITTRAGTVQGLDVDTGERLWEMDSPFADEEDGQSGFVSAVVTDGRFVLLQVDGVPGSGTGLVSVDALAGEVIWSQGGGDDRVDGEDLGQGLSGSLLAVDGRLLEVTPNAVRGLG